MSDSSVDFKTVRENARKQGIQLNEIAIFYSTLTLDEKNAMNEENLITHDAGHGIVIARFRSDGTPAFPQKATGIHYLGAD